MYRLEIDALNAIYTEQKRTNELLEQLLERGVNNGSMHENEKGLHDDSVGDERNIHGDSVQIGDVQPSTGNSQRGRKRNS